MDEARCHLPYTVDPQYGSVSKVATRSWFMAKKKSAKSQLKGSKAKKIAIAAAAAVAVGVTVYALRKAARDAGIAATVGAGALAVRKKLKGRATTRRKSARSRK
jgi:hypothetical protein